MNAFEVTLLSACQLGDAFRAGTLSPREACASYLERIDELNPVLNAFCFVDPEKAMRQAALSEQRHLRRATLGPLDGVPVAVKDVLLVEDWPTRRGSRAVAAGEVASHDSPAVRRLREHGAVLIGKTTTSEFGWKAVTDSPLNGASRNPWDQRLTPGGSSGGSAVAVASGMAPLALGTDGGGSVRIPASFCGVVGLKPTLGRVAQWPRSPFAPVSHVGLMAWTVSDARVLLDVLAGPDELDPQSRLLGSLDECSTPRPASMKIAFSGDLGYASVADEVNHAVRLAAAQFKALGAVVTHVDPGFTDPIDYFGTIWSVGAARAVRAFTPEQREMMDVGLIQVAEAGTRVGAVDYLVALDAQHRLAEDLERFFLQYDLLITPSVPIVPFPVDQEVPEGWPSQRWMSWTPFTYPFNLAATPAVSVPCGFSSSGLPIGLQIIGAKERDDLVMAAAAAFEVASLPRRRPDVSPGRLSAEGAVGR